MDDEINLLDYWRVIAKRKWLIIGLALVCAFTSLVYSLMQPKMYKATATIMPVDTGGGGLGSALSVMGLLGGGAVGGGDAKLTPILKSNSLAKMVANDLELDKYFPKLAKNDKLQAEEKLTSAAGSLQGAVDIKNMDGLLGISIIWPKPEPTAELANLYVEKLGKFLNARALNVNFQVIDPAVAPKAPFKPKIKLNVILGGVLGLFMGVFIAFFLEYLGKLPKT